jgi:lipopolysaccharide transport system permease protein
MTSMLQHNVWLAFMLGWQDLKQSYRRSPIGPFWLTLNSGILIATMGVVFGVLFDMELRDYLPYLAVGLVTWNFLSTALNEACNVFVLSEGLIKQINLPVYVYILRLMWKNFTIYLHNIVLIPIVVLLTGRPLTWTALLFFVGLALVLVNLGWVVLALGIVATRYRDFSQITFAFLNITFYLTPIVWDRKTLDHVEWAQWLVTLNPLASLIEIVRAPILGTVPSLLTWQIVIGLAIGGWALALVLFRRYRYRIAYWV